MARPSELIRVTIEALRAQGTYSQGRFGPGCYYRGERGTKCAAGLHIREEDYKPEWEFSTVLANSEAGREIRAALGRGSALLGRGLTAGEIETLAQLQGLHDNHATRGLPLETCIAAMEKAAIQ